MSSYNSSQSSIFEFVPSDEELPEADEFEMGAQSWDEGLSSVPSIGSDKENFAPQQVMNDVKEETRTASDDHRIAFACI